MIVLLRRGHAQRISRTVELCNVIVDLQRVQVQCMRVPGVHVQCTCIYNLPILYATRSETEYKGQSSGVWVKDAILKKKPSTITIVLLLQEEKLSPNQKWSGETRTNLTGGYAHAKHCSIQTSFSSLVPCLRPCSMI